MAFDLKKKLADIAKRGTNQTEAQTGGGDYTPPPEGPCFLRLVGYIEKGKHKSTYSGETKIKDKVELVFELSGKNYPPREVNGEKIPVRIAVRENLSLSDRSLFFKLFNTMRNGREDITHMAQMLGEGFLGRVYHDTWKDKKGNDKVTARLRDDTGYSIRPPYREDPETGESTKVAVPAYLSQLRLFVWELADKEMWDSLFIDGEYEEGRTKNVFQQAILDAENFEGSPIHQLLAGAVDDDADPGDDVPPFEPDEPPKDKPKATGRKRNQTPAADPLAGVGDDDIPY